MERAPLLTPIPSQFAEDELPLGPSSGGNERRARVAEVLESAELHWTVLGLTSIDALAVLSEIGWEFLKDPACKYPGICDNSCPEPPHILEAFSALSLLISSTFLVEIPLALYAFGLPYFTTLPNAHLHIFDALIILTTFILEFFLKGKESEIAALLVVFRFWRVLKLVSTVGVGVSELDEQRGKRWEHDKKILLQELEVVRRELEGIKSQLV